MTDRNDRTPPPLQALWQLTSPDIECPRDETIPEAKAVESIIGPGEPFTIESMTPHSRMVAVEAGLEQWPTSDIRALMAHLMMLGGEVDTENQTLLILKRRWATEPRETPIEDSGHLEVLDAIPAYEWGDYDKLTAAVTKSLEGFSCWAIRGRLKANVETILVLLETFARYTPNTGMTDSVTLVISCAMKRGTAVAIEYKILRGLIDNHPDRDKTDTLLTEALVQTGLTKSRGEACQLIKGGAVIVDSFVVTDRGYLLDHSCPHAITVGTTNPRSLIYTTDWKASDD